MTHKKPVLVRVTTIPLSLEKLLTGQMHFMHEEGFEVYMISSSGPGTAALEQQEKSKFIAVEMTRRVSLLKDLIAVWNMCKVFRKIRPTIVHTHTPKAGLIGMLAARICNVPIRLHTIAGLPWMETEGLFRKILMGVEKLTAFCAHRVYPNSQVLKTFLTSNRILPAKKLKVIGRGSSNGIQTNYYERSRAIDERARELRQQMNGDEDSIIFIFIGRIVKDKGINELAQAFNILEKKYDFIRLLIVGPFEDELDPIDEISRQIIEKNSKVFTVGYQQDVRPYLAASDILVFPSYREGFPNVPMQAGCFNLPSVVTDINGCNEIIENGVNGLVIPVKNVSALEAAMERMINDKKLRERCADNARKMIVENYDQEFVWQSIFDEYVFLLKEKGLEFKNV